MSFNIRVYGILLRNDNEVLVTDEELQDLSFTKFPGGGLEFGEGLKECLIREFMEELQLPISVKDLFYLTEHFQVSAFSESEQLISIYYYVETLKTDMLSFLMRIKCLDISEKPRWVPIKDLNDFDFMFPVDKIVVNKLLQTYN